MDKIFPLFIVLIPFVLYFFVILKRKYKFKKVALLLGAKYINEGFFKNERIEGDDFVVSTVKVGGGRSSSFFTRISLKCLDIKDNLLLKTSFFEKFPDWKYAKTLGKSEERVFITTVLLDRYIEVNDEQKKLLVEVFSKSECNKENIFRELKANKIDQVIISPGGLEIRFRGVMQNGERMRRTIELLRTICNSFVSCASLFKEF